MSDTKAKYKWISEYETCAYCDRGGHACYFCGTDLDHTGHESGGIDHTVEYCRPDLVEHDAGPLCTWPDDPEANEYRDPWCYWDHENNKLKEYGVSKP